MKYEIGQQLWYASWESERAYRDTRSWAWNAHYHRKSIKDAQKQIEYHSAKLAVASLKAKEDKAA